MAWMRMPGQTWPGAAAALLCMWVVMMVAMMLPSLVPMLWRYRQAVGRTGETRLGRLTALVGVGYFFVWTVFGMAAFPLGVALAAIEMQQPALARHLERNIPERLGESLGVLAERDRLRQIPSESEDVAHMDGPLGESPLIVECPRLDSWSFSARGPAQAHPILGGRHDLPRRGRRAREVRRSRPGEGRCPRPGQLADD